MLIEQSAWCPNCGGEIISKVDRLTEDVAIEQPNCSCDLSSYLLAVERQALKWALEPQREFAREGK